ncbi:MAG TPA: aspartate/glutamate racemase family protein, partial [Cyclobacteriaceae bacterium]|nr:aspartate/glutamate racemase family protein [Cyclobacteriaceae bacterium]
LGLVGGISWVSTIDYYRIINEEINKRLGGLNYAECIIYSVNFGDFVRNNVANNWDATAKLMTDACLSLERSGAKAIVLCANTAHAVVDKVMQQIKVPVIDITWATAEEIKKLGLRRVGLLGTKFTMEMDFYKKKMMENGVDAFVPHDQSVRDRIQQTIKDELGRGIIKSETKQFYLRAIEKMISEGAQGIILGCTELPMILSQQDITVPVFDTTKIHALAAVDFALS